MINTKESTKKEITKLVALKKWSDLTTDIKLENSIEYLTYGMILLFFTGKVFEVFTILIDILFISLLIVRKERVFIQKHQKVLILFGFLFLYFIVQSMFANHPVKAVVNSVGVIRFVILMFALWYVFDTKEKVKRLTYSIYALITILFVDASVQYFTGKDIFGYPLYGGYRLTLWYEMPKLSEQVAIFWGIVLASFWITNNKKLTFIVLLMLSLMMLFAGNRGPVVYLSGAILFVLLFSPYRKYMLHALLGLVVAFGFLLSTDDKIYAAFERAYTNPLGATGNSGRTPLYKTAVEMIEEHPLIGVGAKNFKYDFPKYYPSVYAQMDEEEKQIYANKIWLDISPTHVHSVFLSMWLNWGLIGMVLVLYIFFKLYRDNIRPNSVAVLSLIGFVYTVAPFNFGKSVVHGQWQFFIFLSFVFALIIANNYKEENDAKA